MSNALNDFKEAAKAKQSDLPPTRNVALRVTAYSNDGGRDFVHGTDISTGEEVRVFLRPMPEEQTKKLKFPRPEIKDFVAQKDEIKSILESLPTPELRKQVASGIKNKTEPGGILILEGVFADKKVGALSARWANSACKYEGGAQVLTDVMARINPAVIDEEQKRGRQTITLVLPELSTPVTSPGELTAALGSAFDNPNGAGAMIRVSDGVTVGAIEVNRGVKKVEESAGVKYVQRPAEEVIAYFMGTDAGKAALKCIGEGTKVEVIPMMTMSMGSATKAGLTKDSMEALRKYDTAYRMPDGKNGFTSSVVVFYPNKGEDGGPHAFTLIKPSLSKNEFVLAEGISTPTISAAHAVVNKVDHPGVEDAPPVEDLAPSFGPEAVDLSDFEGAAPESKPAAPRARTGLGMGM